MKTLKQIINRAKTIKEQLVYIENKIMNGQTDSIIIDIQGQHKGELNGLYFASGLNTIDWLKCMNNNG